MLEGAMGRGGNEPSANRGEALVQALNTIGSFLGIVDGF
jgi:hypothetical protein